MTSSATLEPLSVTVRAPSSSANRSVASRLSGSAAVGVYSGLLRQTQFLAERRESRVTAHAVESRLDAEKEQPRASFLAGALQPLQCATVVPKPGVDERPARAYT